MKNYSKKMLLLAAVLCGCVSVARAADSDDDAIVVRDIPRHYVQFSVGDPLMNGWFGGYFGFCDMGDPFGDPGSWFTPDVYTRTAAILPSFAVNYRYAIKYWLHLGVEVYYGGKYSRQHDRITDAFVGTTDITQLSILPSIRFQYLDRPVVGLYSGVSVGVLFAIESDYLDPKLRFDAVLPAFQLTALGVRVGNRVYGTAEIGVGHKGFFNIGVGSSF